MADTTACGYNNDCPSGGWEMSPQTKANFDAMLWVVCGVIGGCITFPFLYILFNCDYLRSLWAVKQDTDDKKDKHEVREATKRARRAEQSYGSVV